ncbi:unnamed protein product [Lota lota]
MRRGRHLGNKVCVAAVRTRSVTPFQEVIARFIECTVAGCTAAFTFAAVAVPWNLNQHSGSLVSLFNDITTHMLSQGARGPHTGGD